MNKKINELLSVLDMSEDRQRDWVSSNVPLQYSSYPLADLAFRMSDEVNIETGMVYVDKYLHYRGIVSIPELTLTGAVYFTNKIKPIEIIIAAFIAKELSNETR